jgi:hypothetical protein
MVIPYSWVSFLFMTESFDLVKKNDLFERNNMFFLIIFVQSTMVLLFHVFYLGSKLRIAEIIGFLFLVSGLSISEYKLYSRFNSFKIKENKYVKY